MKTKLHELWWNLMSWLSRVILNKKRKKRTSFHYAKYANCLIYDKKRGAKLWMKKCSWKIFFIIIFRTHSELFARDGQWNLMRLSLCGGGGLRTWRRRRNFIINERDQLVLFYCCGLILIRRCSFFSLFLAGNFFTQNNFLKR